MLLGTQMMARGASREWDGGEFFANTIEGSKLRRLCNVKARTVAFLRECVTDDNVLKAHYDLDKLKTGGNIERLREWRIKANFVHKLGKTVAKGPIKDLTKRWHKVEADIREFMFDVLQKGLVHALLCRGGGVRGNAEHINNINQRRVEMI